MTTPRDRLSPLSQEPADGEDPQRNDVRSGVRFGLPRTARLRTPGDFRRVYGQGNRAHGRLLVVVGFPRRDPGHRLGVAVSKEHGRAVRRNKLKRILREAFRLERPELPGAFDLILIPRPRDGHLELADVRAELRRLVEQLRTGGRPRGRSGGRSKNRRRR